MKFSSFILTAVSTVVFSSWAAAQTVDAGKIDAEHEGTTTIKIEKTKNGQTPPSVIKNKWEIHESTADVEGDASATEKEAKAAWKKACDNWKKEVRADNKDVVSTNCGKASCSGEAGSKVCTSTASFKIKTKVEEQ